MASSDAPASEKQTSGKTFLSEAILVAAASALSYAVAFAYRSGFASYFGLPPLLLTPTIGGILQAGATVGASLLFLGVIVNGLWLFVPRKDSVLARHIKRMLFIFVLGVLGAYRLFAERWGWVVLLGLLCLFGFGLFIFPLISQRQVRSYENKLLAQEKVEARSDLLLDAVGRRMGDKALLFAFAAFVLVYFANSLGYTTAKNQQDYFVLADMPDHVVAAMDDDMVVLVGYDPTAMTIRRQYIIRRFSSEPVWLLEKKHIGKLREPPPLKASSPR
jgi:hypothetical protein